MVYLALIDATNRTGPSFNFSVHLDLDDAKGRVMRMYRLRTQDVDSLLSWRDVRLGNGVLIRSDLVIEGEVQKRYKILVTRLIAPTK